MTNRFYVQAGANLAQANIDWVGGDIRVQAIDLAAYTPNFATDDSLADIPGGARIGDPVALSGMTATNSILDADDATIAIDNGEPEIEAFVIYQHHATEAQALLILYIDVAVNLPYTPTGVDFTLIFPSGSNRIARLIAA